MSIRRNPRPRGPRSHVLFARVVHGQLELDGNHPAAMSTTVSERSPIGRALREQLDAICGWTGSGHARCEHATADTAAVNRWWTPLAPLAIRCRACHDEAVQEVLKNLAAARRPLHCDVCRREPLLEFGFVFCQTDLANLAGLVCRSCLTRLAPTSGGRA